MLISYPFLPARGASTSEADYEQVIQDLEIVNSGVYPSSHEREWHGGIHIQAPTYTEPVRAIADGTLVAYRLNTELTKERPEDTAGRIDNSFVLIRHETESDSLTGNNGAETPVKVAFYSLYMHLMNTAEMATQGVDRHQIHRAISESGQVVKLGNSAKIYRKDVIGFPGESYSTTGMIHFEIFMTDDQLNGFFVDSQNAAQVGTKGTWGNSYYVVKAGSPAVGAHPSGHSKIGKHAVPPGNAGTVNPSKDLFVRVAFRNGTKYTTTWVAGEEDQPPTLLTSEEGVADADYEYDMFDIATALYPSCPSAGMELLRFGKVIGPDAGRLATNEQHNWQFITYANGQQGYLDLADSTVVRQVLSDADFPYWLGWQKGIGGLFADSGQCSMHGLLDVLKVSRDGERTDAARRQLHGYLSDPEHRHLRDWVQRLIVQYPSEWDKTNNARCLKLKEKDGLGPGRDGPFVGDDDEFSKHMQFVESLQWWSDVGFGDSNVWHFHPFAFIKHFRMCGWLSVREVAQVVQGGGHRTISSVSDLFVSELLDPHNASRVMRPSHLHSPLMRCMRKYGIVNVARRAHWFGQILQETGIFRYMRELGDNSYFTNYYEGRCRSPVQRHIHGKLVTLSPLGNCNPGDGARYSGKGMIQITGGDNFRGYQSYRGGINFTVDPGPEAVITDAYNACDAGGYYWASKQRMRKDPVTHRLVTLGKLGVNFWAEKVELSSFGNAESTNAVIDEVTRCVNPGLDGKENRRAYFKHAYSYLSDMVSEFPSDYHPMKE